jgi:hypothetical protein
MLAPEPNRPRERVKKGEGGEERGEGERRGRGEVFGGKDHRPTTLAELLSPCLLPLQLSPS